MLAEIFLLKLEFLVHATVAKRAASNGTRFVPITLPFGFRAAPAHG
ncbi:MAG: hypothetical protein WCA36_05530 [Pseudolabrys sp.]|jgi:hypothetical protein